MVIHLKYIIKLMYPANDLIFSVIFYSVNTYLHLALQAPFGGFKEFERSYTLYEREYYISLY